MLELQKNGTKWDIISDIDGDIRLFSIGNISVKLLELFHRSILDKGYAKLFVETHTFVFNSGTTFKCESFSIIPERGENITLLSSKEDTIEFIAEWIARMKPKSESSSLAEIINNRLRDAFPSSSSEGTGFDMHKMFSQISNPTVDDESKGTGFDKDEFIAGVYKVFSQNPAQASPEDVEDKTAKLNKVMENISKFVTE